MARELALPTWPGGASVAVSLTFDVDADTSLAGWAGAEFAQRLSARSYFRFGPARGLVRVLKLLADRSIRGTFYVPGATALAYPQSVAEIVKGGHEIGHHGHRHVPPHTASTEVQREELDQGLQALKEVLDVRPRGYRSPSAELTQETLEMLVERGFAYDSSCMGDDRPYLEEAGAASILELPLEWHLDDASYFLYFYGEGGQIADPEEVMRHWWSEFTCAAQERSLFTLVMHPEIIGRGARLPALAGLIDRMTAHTDVWFATHGEVAELVSAQRAAQV